MYFLPFALCVGCAVAFFILLIGKLGLRDLIILKAPVLISKLFECDFCLSFWLSLLFAIIFAIDLSNAAILFTPIVSTVIARVLI